MSAGGKQFFKKYVAILRTWLLKFEILEKMLQQMSALGKPFSKKEICGIRGGNQYLLAKKRVKNIFTFITCVRHRPPPPPPP